MASNPGGVNLNISPYFDDYDEDKKFVRVLYRPGRAVQARELSQSQTYQQKQIQRFADYFFKQGSIVNGCEQNLDLRMEYVKLQSTFGVGASVATVNVASFLNETVVGANTGVRAYVGLVSDIEDDDPKTYLTALRKVVEARGGMATVAQKTDLSRETLYRTLSSRGNPTIRTLSAVLKATGLKFGVTAH